jgi:hypothetical protein
MAIALEFSWENNIFWKISAYFFRIISKKVKNLREFECDCHGGTGTYQGLKINLDPAVLE